MPICPGTKMGKRGNDTEGEEGNEEQEKWSVARRKEEGRNKVRIYRFGKKREGEKPLCYTLNQSACCQKKKEEESAKHTSETSHSQVEEARLAKHLKSVLLGRLSRPKQQAEPTRMS